MICLKTQTTKPKSIGLKTRRPFSKHHIFRHFSTFLISFLVICSFVIEIIYRLLNVRCLGTILHKSSPKYTTSVSENDGCPLVNFMNQMINELYYVLSLFFWYLTDIIFIVLQFRKAIDCLLFPYSLYFLDHFPLRAFSWGVVAPDKGLPRRLGCRIHRQLLCRLVRPPTCVLVVTLNNLMVRFQQCSSFGGCEVSLHCHRSKIHSGLAWSHQIRVLSMGWIELNGAWSLLFLTLKQRIYAELNFLKIELFWH